MTLATSDWISIIGASAQIIVAIAVAIWQVRSNRPPVTSPSQLDAPRFDWKYFFWASWQFFLCAIVAVIGLATTLMSDGAVSKSFVVQLVAFSFLLLFGILGCGVVLVVTAFRPAYLHMSGMVERWKQDAIREVR